MRISSSGSASITSAVTSLSSSAKRAPLPGLDVFFDGLDQVFSLERFCQILIRALFHPPELVAFLVLGGHHDDRNIFELVIAFYVSADLKAVFLRHDHVENDQVHFLGPNLLLRGLAVHNGDDGMAQGLERLLKDLELRQTVVRYQYFGHSLLLFR